MKNNPVIFREYDIRGVYDTDFDKEFAYHLGRAFVTYVRRKSGLKDIRLTLGHHKRYGLLVKEGNISRNFRQGLVPELQGRLWQVRVHVLHRLA